MPAPTHQKVRDARDRLIDLLGLGETYPLRDVDVQEEQLTVNFEQPSAFEINPGQQDVVYELLAEDGSSLVPPRTVTGTGDVTDLPGPVITKDRTFKIRATKIGRPSRTALLLQSAIVKVGLNTKLRAYLVNLPPLNPGNIDPADTDPRIIDHGSTALVTVEDAQQGAEYRLVYTGPNGQDIVTTPILAEENGEEITLSTLPLTEDTVIRIRVTRVFDPSEGRPNLQATLDAALPLAVRANPAAAVSVEGSALDGSPLVDPLGPVTLTVAGSQTSVIYSAFVRQLGDADFEVSTAMAVDVVPIAVPAGPDMPAHAVLIHKPQRPSPWQAQSGYAQKGEIKQGNGGALKLDLGSIHDDSAIVVQAHKDHKDIRTGQVMGQSSLQLAQPAFALPRPDPASGLTLTVTPGAGGSATMLVTGGQRGVFYHFRQTAGGPVVGRPAYFHRLDEQDPAQNLGVTQLRIGNDLAVARSVGPGATPALQRPLDPLVDLAQTPAGNALSVTAVWARTGVAWVTARTITTTST